MELERLTRLYHALSQINQAVVTMPTRGDLFTRVCQVLVEHGGFRMAWVGWHDAATRRILPVAQWGDEQGYVQRITIFGDDRPEGRGPSGTAFRERRPYICNDMQTDPSTMPWRAAAISQGFRASAVLPITLAGTVEGTLSVYASAVGFFQDKEVALLTQAAADLSFGLDNLAREEARQRAAAAASSERAFSEAMLDSMPGILYLYDEGGRFIRWNRNFLAVSGYTAEEMAHRHPLDFFSAADRALLQGRITEVFERGESFVEASFVSKDGRETPYFFTGRRVEVAGSRCLVGMGIDISERKQAEAALRASEERYRTTLDNILESCQLIGFDWRYLYLNDAAAVQNRRSNHDLLGRTMLEAWPGIEQSDVFALLRVGMEERRPVHGEIAFQFPNGESGWFDVRCQPAPEGIFVLSIDITDRKRAEQRLRELNESLEGTVTRRTEELRVALVRAESADRAKSAFLATMSHELRTPLNSIIGFTGIVLQGLAGPLTTEQVTQLGMVRGSARHLLDLINDVLDISKIEAGQMEVRTERFDLRASFDRVLASVAPLAAKKALALTMDLSPAVTEMVGDRRRVEQIALNLLSNAIKFTDHGRVVLAATVTEKPEAGGGRRQTLTFTVSDSGIGIIADDIGTLFQPFRQLDIGLSRQRDGTGLGLAICRRLARLMGGDIAAESTLGQGSVFTVTLPLEPDAS